jgi:hypothetical protein
VNTGGCHTQRLAAYIRCGERSDQLIIYIYVLVSVRGEVESYESFVIQERWPDSEGPPMWTNENRARYDRSHLRYPSDLTDDE